MHCDAFVYSLDVLEYLVIDWHEGGRKLIARDCYLIDDDGLTAVWSAERVILLGRPVFWSYINAARMARVHQTVLAQRARMIALGAGRWTVVSTLAHYVRLRETDGEITGEANAYKPPRTRGSVGPYVPTGRPRGRPRKGPVLPDWL